MPSDGFYCVRYRLPYAAVLDRWDKGEFFVYPGSYKSKEIIQY